MATKKRQSSASPRRSTPRRGAGKKAAESRGKYTTAIVIGVVLLIGIIIGTYVFKKPVDALAVGCSSGYNSPLIPRDADWNTDGSLVITQNLSEPTYDPSSRSCSWKETVTVTNQQGVERKSCDVHIDGQSIACPEAGQTMTVFSGVKTGDPNQAPYLSSELYVEEVLSDGVTYTSAKINY